MCRLTGARDAYSEILSREMMDLDATHVTVAAIQRLVPEMISVGGSFARWLPHPRTLPASARAATVASAQDSAVEQCIRSLLRRAVAAKESATGRPGSWAASPTRELWYSVSSRGPRPFRWPESIWNGWMALISEPSNTLSRGRDFRAELSPNSGCYSSSLPRRRSSKRSIPAVAIGSISPMSV